MISSKASRRYATALLRLSIDEELMDAVFADAEMMKATFSGSRELHLILMNPVVRKEKKLSILTDVFKSRVSELSWRFIELLSGKDRLAILPGVMTDFIRQYYIHAGILEVHIVSAYDLDASQRKKLLDALTEQTGKTVKPFFGKDPDLRGGLVVRIDDTVIDGSVKHKLEQLQQTLYKSAV
jgi:F-type H+-transporting ATPase subunit delta